MDRSTSMRLAVLALTGLTAVISAGVPAEAGVPVRTASTGTPTPPPPAASAAQSRYWVAIGLNSGGLDWPATRVVLLNCDSRVPPVAPRSTCLKLATVGGDISRLPVPRDISCSAEYDPSVSWVLGIWGGRPVGTERVWGNPCRLHTVLADVLPFPVIPRG